MEETKVRLTPVCWISIERQKVTNCWN